MRRKPFAHRSIAEHVAGDGHVPHAKAADARLVAGRCYHLPDGTRAVAWRARGPYWALDAEDGVRYTVGPDGGILCQDRPTGLTVEMLEDAGDGCARGS